MVQARLFLNFCRKLKFLPTRVEVSCLSMSVVHRQYNYINRLRYIKTMTHGGGGGGALSKILMEKISLPLEFATLKLSFA